MKIWLKLILLLVCWQPCHLSTMVINIVEILKTESFKLECNVSPTNLTRWTYLSGSTGTSLMSYQNGLCTVSPSDSFLNDRSRYSYTCNSTLYEITVLPTNDNHLNNDILACRDAIQPDRTGPTWMIKIIQDAVTCNCNQTITFSIIEITEGNNVTLICRVSSDVQFVNWNILGSNTAAMSGQNGQCTTQGTTFLDDISKYIYTCNTTVYQVTRFNVQRKEHNDMYTCTPSEKAEGTGSNWIIKVKAPVTSVTLTPANSSAYFKENTVVEFICKTSTARPAAFVYWYIHPNGNSNDITRITDNITTTTDYNDLSVITSTLHFVPTQQHNGMKIYCEANNSVNTSPKKSKKILLNVQYEAEHPYIVQGSNYREIEATSGTLSCTVKGGKPTPTLSWSCTNFSPTNQTTVISNGNTTKPFTWNVSKNHSGTCTCTSQQTDFPNKTVIVSLIVLYPPSKPIFRVNGSSVGGNISFIEGKTRAINCTTDSNPSADKYLWRGPTITGTENKQSLRLSNIRKMDAGEYKCSVHNTMNPSTGGPVAGNNTGTVNVIVLYPPSALYFIHGNQNGQNISNKVIDVIQGDTFDIVCKSIDGNPAPTIKWNVQSNNAAVLKVENIQDSRTNATCTASNNMTETNREAVHGSITDTIKFNILTLPTVKGCAFHYSNQSTVVNLSNNITNIKVIEKETITFKCSTEGKPSPNVWWKTPQRSFVSSSTVTVKNLTREMKGNYVFTANSLLEPSFKEKQNVTVNKTISVQVLYPPVVYSMNDVSKQNGTLLNMVCNYTAGMPETTTVKWTRDIDETKWNTTTLNIESLENSDTGIYTCTASNIMKQSGDDKSYIGQHNQSFHLDVQYAASISSFTIDGLESKNVTVNESNSVILTCTGDSNPPAMMTLSDKKETLKTVSSNNVEYNIPEASCHDAGIYYCSAINIHNNGSEVQNVVQLFVNCLPRVGDDIDVNVTSEKNSTVTIVFNGIAYPPPTFSWYQLDDGDWTLLHKGDNYAIQSADSQSNLTIHSVSMNNFTSYKVIVENKFGLMEQVYTLSPYDKPDPPTSLRHIVGLTTASSIHIEWKPGFDNGPSQTFYIKYKKSSDTVWNYLSVSDNGEPTMNITLTGLLENTQYDVIIFASNVKGNSTESSVLITRTKAIQNPTSIPGALIGGIAGGVTGCIVIVIVIVFIIRRYPLFKGNGANRQNVRRSVSDDSNDEDGLVDNPMYASSSNVAPVASTSASTSTDIYSTPVKPNKTNVAGNGDIYSVVNKTKEQGKGGKCKSTNEKGKQKEGDVYENVELENNPNKKDAGKQLPPKPPAEQPKLKIVNQDGLIYADLLFKDKPPGEKMVILGDDPTPYDLVDFTKKADPLPESDEEEHK